MNGQPELSIEVLGVEDRGSSLDNVRDFIVRPEEPWFSVGERLLIERGLSGKLGPAMNDCLLVARYGRELAGTLWYQVSMPSAVGVLGFVHTHPKFRGRGVASRLTELALELFVRAGGLCLFLGTRRGSTAYRIYERNQFREYNGNVMRYLDPSVDPAILQEQLYSKGRNTTMRNAAWSDLGVVTALYAMPGEPALRDYRQKLFAHPSIRHRGCISMFAALMLRAEKDNNRFTLLEKKGGGVVGCCSIVRLAGPAENDVAEVEFCLHPDWMTDGVKLVRTGLQEGSRDGIRIFRSYLIGRDDRREEFLRELGFVQEAVFVNQVRLGTGYADLRIFRLSG